MSDLDYDEAYNRLHAARENCRGSGIELDLSAGMFAINELRARLAELEAENERLERLAADALAAWDSDQDARCGKLLRAMVDKAFCDVYRPDLRSEK